MIEQIYLTVRELKESVGALQRLAGMDMPVKAAYRISSTLNRVEDELKKHNLAVSELIEKNSGSVEPGGNVTWETDLDEKNFRDAVAELDGEHVSITNTPVEIGLLGDKVSLSPAIFMATSWLFTE